VPVPGGPGGYLRGRRARVLQSEGSTKRRDASWTAVTMPGGFLLSGVFLSTPIFRAARVLSGGVVLLRFSVVNLRGAGEP
jgi:hypothetical protein